MSSDTQPTTTDTSSRREVVLVPSALFHTVASTIPPGVRARDLTGYVEGLVEEETPLPLDQTAWGFLLDSTSKRAAHLLHYAAAADITIPPHTSSSLAVIPGFATLNGLSFSRNTWVFLLEDECLSAVFFKPSSAVPSRIISRFFEKPNTSADEIYSLRNKLEQIHVTPDDDDIIPGLVRPQVTPPVKPSSLRFTLEQQLAPGEEWLPWKKTSLKKRTRLLAADVRDHTLLRADVNQRKSTRTIAVSLASLATLILLLGVLEIVLSKMRQEADSLSELAAEQQKTVKRIQDMETMASSIQATFNNPFLPFDWIMAANTPRPRSVSFTSLAIENDGTLTINARATEVKAANDYTRGLRNTGKFTETNLSQIQSGRDGVTFNLSLRTGDLHANPIGPTQPDEEPTANEQTDEPSPDSTETDPVSSDTANSDSNPA